VGRVSYPGQLEHFWREEARLLWGFLPEEELLQRVRPHVQKLSDRFTVERGAGGPRYGEEPEARLAYGFFFFPQTFVRTQQALRECLARRSPRSEAGDGAIAVLDLGAGAGAAGFAALHALRERDVRLLALDHSTESLATLRKGFESGRNELWPRATLETRVGDLQRLDALSGGWDLVIASFAINEPFEGRPLAAAEEWLRGALGLLKPGGLLILLEPALKETSERLEHLRDRVAADAWAHIVAPCLHARACPLLAEGRYWCHEVRRWESPPLAEKINRTLFRDLPHLKYSFLALAAEAVAPGDAQPNRARLVAPVSEQHGKFVSRGCCADGALRDLDVLARHLSADEKLALRRMERGSRVTFEIERALGSGAVRARALQPEP